MVSYGIRNGVKGYVIGQSSFLEDCKLCVVSHQLCRSRTSQDILVGLDLHKTHSPAVQEYMSGTKFCLQHAVAHAVDQFVCRVEGMTAIVAERCQYECESNTCGMLRNDSRYRQSSDASFHCDPVAEAHIILIAPLRQQRPANQAVIVRQKASKHNN